MEEENPSKMLGPFVEIHRFVCIFTNPMIKNNIESNETLFRAKGDASCGAGKLSCIFCSGWKVLLFLII